MTNRLKDNPSPMTLASAHELTGADDRFGVDLNTTYTRFRVSLVRVLQDVGVDPRSGTSIASRLKVNRQLAWQLATIAAESPCSVGLKLLPGARGMQRFAESCAEHTGNTEQLTELRRALEELEDAVGRHVGDRAELGLFAAAWEPADLERSSEALRRDGYRAQCAVLGVQADAQVRGVVFAPSQRGEPDRIAYAGFQCFAGLTRLRRDRPCRLLYAERPIHDDGSPTLVGGNANPDMEPFLRQQYQLDLDHSTGGEDRVMYLTTPGRGWVALRPGPVGKTASSTLIFSGASSHESMRYRVPTDRYNHLIMLNYVPTETVYVDYLVHRSLANEFDFERAISAACFDATAGVPIRPAKRDDPPLYELGKAAPISPADLRCDVTLPTLHEIVDRAARSVGCAADDLVGLRYRTNYLMASSALVVERVLPSEPGADSQVSSQ